MTSPLRDLLAQRVEAARRDKEAATPRSGAFDALRGKQSVQFATTGWRTGLRREKWWIPFAVDGDVIYLVEEVRQRAAWVQNVLADPLVYIEGMRAVARLVDDPDELARARRLLSDQFGGGEWGLIENGLIVAFDFSGYPEPEQGLQQPEIPSASGETPRETLVELDHLVHGAAHLAEGLDE